MWLNKEHPRKKGSYAITTGTYAGEILVYIAENDQQYDFFSIPKMINRSIPKDKFLEGLTGKIVDYVEQIPSSVHNICELQFKKNSTLSK